MWAAWTVMCIAGAMFIGLKVGRPLYYSDGSQQVAGSDLASSGMLRWNSPDAEFELPGQLTGRVAQMADGRLLYGVVTADGTSDLVTWHPEQPDVPPEPAYGLNTEHNELAPAVGRDGRIYFASDRPDSIGGYDLFVTTLTPRGFGRVTALLPCNTAFDETDPAPDPQGSSLVFVRIDRAIDNGNDGVLWNWRIGDPRDPVQLFPEQDRRRERVIDRDPAFAEDGASLWFVRKERGKDLVVCRSSRLGDTFDAPAGLSNKWGIEALRSPLPMPGGRTVGMVQPPTEQQAALWYVTTAEELVPWWPGQHWLEWLLLSLVLCALLLLLLLYFGQRWSALDLAAQCILLSLLLHVLLFLWLMGVEIAGSLLPGSDDDDSGMQVSIVASTGFASAAAAGAAGDVAAKVQRKVRERNFEVAEPGTSTARSELDHQASLAVDNGSYQAEPVQNAAQSATEQQLEDAAAAAAVRNAADASAGLEQAQLSAVEQSQQAAAAAAARSQASSSEFAAQVVQVTTPGSGMQRAAGRAVELAAGDAESALPMHTAAATAPGPTAPALHDAATAGSPANAPQRADADAAPVGLSTQATLANAPAAANVAQPKRGKAQAKNSETVAMPDSVVGRSSSVRIEPSSSQRTVAYAAPRKVSVPNMPLRGAIASGATALPTPAPSGPAPRASVAALAVAAPAQPETASMHAARSPRTGQLVSPTAALPTPGSSLRRSTPKIAMRGPSSQNVPRAGRRGGVRVALRDPLATGAGNASKAVGKPSNSSEPAATAPIVARASDLPTSPLSSPSFAPRRNAVSRSSSSGAFAERFPVTPPGTRLARQEPRRSVLPRLPQPAIAKSAYSNRFGPAKAKALERFGGTTETERAVRDGLQYLASIQNRNGSWGDQKDYDGKYGFVYIGKSALCVLAFLGAGHTPTSATEHSEVVTRAIAHLIEVQDEDTGAFGSSSCYGHGITTYAIAECYGLTKTKPYGDQLVQPLEDGLTWILANQGPRPDPRNRGGWGYFSPGMRAEDSYARVSVSSWMIMALESARMSGVELPEDVMPAAKQYLELSFDRANGWFRYNQKPSRLRSGWPTLPASTPAGGFCLMLLGAKTDDQMVNAAVDYTVERRPQRYRRYRDDDFVLRGQGNVYFWYYGSLCCFLKGGEAWDRWNARLSTVLPAAQAKDGSFPPIDVYAEEAGDTRRDRSYTTAMCVLSLEVYYRYFTPLLLGR
ncbi:MAG: hypothetical protein ACJAUC_003199 [Planctomycetota bacterium]|jgi:hypothetical protein